MKKLSIPDGIQLAWDERGHGPLVVLANQFFGQPETFAGLLEDLERDHRVVTYDVRGIGASTRRGPYDLATDAADLEALIEAAGPPAVVLAFADGCNRAVRVAARRPELVTGIVSPAGNPVGRRATQGTDSLAASDSVLAALVEMMGTDYRGALRTIFSTANPDWDNERVRQRVSATVESVPQEAALFRMREWIEDHAVDEGLAVGDGLWLLADGTVPWFSIEVAHRTREILPDAHVLEVEDGPISRPDIAAGVIRRLTAGDAVGSRSETKTGRV
jgi:pimeloyl-ACP methyl ester carboxylesterase